MFFLDEFQSLTSDLNFRPLLFNGVFVKSLLEDERFSEMGLYVVNLRNTRVTQPVCTLRYILFDENKKPYFFDGKEIKRVNTRLLKNAGLHVDSELSNTSFVLPRSEFESIMELLNSAVTDSRWGLKTKYVIFALDGFPEYTIHYEIISSFLSSGGGPGGTGPKYPAY